MRFLPTLIYNADRAIERDMVEAVNQDLAEAFSLSPLERAMHEEQERKERLIQEHDATAQRISKLKTDLAFEEGRFREEAIAIDICTQAEKMAKAGLHPMQQIAAE